HHLYPHAHGGPPTKMNGTSSSARLENADRHARSFIVAFSRRRLGRTSCSASRTTGSGGRRGLNARALRVRTLPLVSGTLVQLLLTWLFTPGYVLFDCNVDLRPQQQHQTGHEEPKHQYHHRANPTVRRLIVAEVFDVHS